MKKLFLSIFVCAMLVSGTYFVLNRTTNCLCGEDCACVVCDCQ